ncbi:ABC transporter substrate-binding protein [Aldersonia sp. NBC_00410]|uniref:ABC transporter substrate-binding protein n=1 Tax=Aldersonia sp. NBC_00410 TaxID=2975954 RepID=UPI0022549969|nr:ABC transporter substrate-binding protein [Aldersonia sp. NBC_00410]MCX5046737.1 ABC transporter substrate-binding protein [Aldersonia sp. NBC_00410]
MPFRAASVRTRLLGIVVAATCAVVAVASCSSEADDDASTIVRTTTAVAGAAVVGLERDTSQACAAPSAPDADADATREITHVAGISTVPTDPQRIVVLSTEALDAMCALGLWERVVAAATLDGPAPQPTYLGSGIASIPSVGPIGNPDPQLIAQAKPDVIIGGDVPASVSWRDLDAIAPTVFTGAPDDWRAQFRSTATAVGRTTAGTTALDDYRRAAADAGARTNSAQTEASVVRFTPDAITVLGADSFAGQVLADTGVRRPASQRGDSFEVADDALEPADGDLIYAVLPAAGKDHAIEVMDSDAWLDLGAADDHRVFAVDDTIWSGNGVAAARALVDDLTVSLNGYAS